ncbi:MAG TPA: SRPBCC family protein [Solirubrobacterales bacterium]|nr:SRPBCC family protein [Solirubrobacterales bacterium]
MPTVARSRVIGASATTIWSLVADPHNLPRWWPETSRVEDVEGEPGARRGRFTQVMRTSGGRPVRADYRCAEATAQSRLLWRQELDGTPFAGFLRSAELEIRLEAGEGRTAVTILARRRLRGMSRLGSPMMRRATGRTLERALDGIERTIPGGDGVEGQ